MAKIYIFLVNKFAINYYFIILIRAKKGKIFTSSHVTNGVHSDVALKRFPVVLSSQFGLFGQVAANCYWLMDSLAVDLKDRQLAKRKGWKKYNLLFFLAKIKTNVSILGFLGANNSLVRRSSSNSVPV